ncbi:MAG: AAA family ATPase [Lachnospira sp.]|nr:AAA family ATPase [Lachnospira sp.]
MYITEVYVENFGVLKDYRYEPQKGFNYIYGENGTGKSTFAEFIKAIFYGMPQTRTRKNLDDALRKKYMPWDGGKCGGYICFEVKGRKYRLSRYFGEKEKDDIYALYDVKTGLVSKDYAANIGEELFGVDREAFSSTAWIGTKSMEVNANDSVHAKLGETMEFDADISNCEKGLNRLEEAQRQYVRTGRRGLVYETEDALAQLEAKKHEQELCVNNLGERLTKLKNKGTEIKDNDKANDANGVLEWDEASKKRLELLDDHFSKGIPNEEKLGKLIVESQIKQGVLDEKRKKSAKTAKILKNIAISIMVLMVLLVIVGVIAVLVVKGTLKGMLYELFWYAMVVGSACMAVASVVGLFAAKAEKGGKAVKTEQERAVTLCKRYEKELRLVKEYNELSQKEEAYSNYREQLAKTAYDQEVAAVTDKYDNSVAKLQNLKDTQKDYQSNLMEYRNKAEIISKAKKYLEDARNSYITNYKDTVVESLKKYLAVFDEKLAETVMMDTELTLSVLEGAEAKEINYFSTGYKDIMWFCERLAIVDSVYVKEKPALILDDAFIAMDDKMYKKAMTLLKELSSDMQIIYMTCKENN